MLIINEESDMSEDWDFYMCHIEDAPASIFLDLSLNEGAPLTDLDTLLQITYTMNSPLENGLSSSEEAEHLYQLEDKLMDILEPTQHSYVGRLTHAGTRTFYVYTSSETLGAVVGAVLQGMQGTPLQTETTEDAQWSYYLEWLYPSATELNEIHTRRLVMKLQEHGDQIESERPVDHGASFRSEEDARAFADEFEMLEFDVELKQLDEQEPNRYFVNIQRNDIVTLEHINPLVREIVTRVSHHKGTYEGWGCPIIQ